MRGTSDSACGAIQRGPKWRRRSLGRTYAVIENEPFTRRHDHPSMLAAFGVLPDVGLIDAGVMERMLRSVASDWDWPRTRGWDYPMMAMTAARRPATHAVSDSGVVTTSVSTEAKQVHAHRRENYNAGAKVGAPRVDYL